MVRNKPMPIWWQFSRYWSLGFERFVCVFNGTWTSYHVCEGCMAFIDLKPRAHALWLQSYISRAHDLLLHTYMYTLTKSLNVLSSTTMVRKWFYGWTLWGHITTDRRPTPSSLCLTARDHRRRLVTTMRQWPRPFRGWSLSLVDWKLVSKVGFIGVFWRKVWCVCWCVGMLVCVCVC